MTRMSGRPVRGLIVAVTVAAAARLVASPVYADPEQGSYHYDEVEGYSGPVVLEAGASTSYNYPYATSHHAGGTRLSLEVDSAGTILVVSAQSYPGTGMPEPKYTLDLRTGSMLVESWPPPRGELERRTLVPPEQERSNFYDYVKGLGQIIHSVSWSANPSHPFLDPNPQLAGIEHYVRAVKSWLEANVTEVADLEHGYLRARRGQRVTIPIKYQVAEATTVEVEVRDNATSYDRTQVAVSPGRGTVDVTLTMPVEVRDPESLAVHIRVLPGPFSELRRTI
jgi:hypothetical protein